MAYGPEAIPHPQRNFATAQPAEASLLSTGLPQRLWHHVSTRWWAPPLLVGLCIRLTVVTFHNLGFPKAWGGEMVAVATALMHGRGFADLYGTPTGPTAHLLPIYPGFLAGVFLLFGITPLAGYCAMYVNAVLSASIVIPLRCLGEQFFSARATKCAVWAWVVWPLAGHTEAIYIWDTSLLALLAISILALAGTRRWILLGVLVGIAALTDSSINVIGVLAIAYSAWVVDWRKALASTVLSAMIVAPWIGRNVAMFHGKVLLRSNLGIELARGASEDELATVRNAIHLPNRDSQELDAYQRLGEVEYNRQKLDSAKSAIRGNPRDYARKVGQRFVAFWAGNRELNFLFWPTGRFKLLKHLFYVLPAMLSLLEVVVLLRQRRKESLLFLATLALFPAIYYLATASPRYRGPIEPLLILLSAHLLHRVLAPEPPPGPALPALA